RRGPNRKPNFLRRLSDCRRPPLLSILSELPGLIADCQLLIEPLRQEPKKIRCVCRNFVAFVLAQKTRTAQHCSFSTLCALTVLRLTHPAQHAELHLCVGAVLEGHLHQMGLAGRLAAGRNPPDQPVPRPPLRHFVCRTVSTTWTVGRVLLGSACLAVWRQCASKAPRAGAPAWCYSACVATAAAVNSYVIPGSPANDAGLCRANRLFRIGRNVSLLMQSLAPWLLCSSATASSFCTLRRGRAAASAAAPLPPPPQSPPPPPRASPGSSAGGCADAHSPATSSTARAGTSVASPTLSAVYSEFRVYLPALLLGWRGSSGAAARLLVTCRLQQMRLAANCWIQAGRRPACGPPR
uniref:F-box domain-containing protein n=1 Tax=Macrostomum lignano TaxID=282301 RepID=A0A1I8FBY7_9PLAT